MSCSPWGRYESDTTEWLHFHFHFHALEKDMATYSSVLAWRIPGMREPGGLPSMGLHRVEHDWSNLAAAAPDSILKRRDVTFVTKVHLLKAMVFPVIMCKCENWTIKKFSSVQFSQSCPTLCHPMDCSMPGFPVHHRLPELAQTHVHWVRDAIQPSHPLSSLSPSAFHLPQHHCLFKWVSSLHQVAKVLEFQLQHQSFQWIFRTDFL